MMMMMFRLNKGICVSSTTRSFSQTGSSSSSFKKNVVVVPVKDRRIHEPCSMFLNKHNTNNKHNTVIKALCDNLNKTMMDDDDDAPNIATYNSLIDAHCVKGEIDKARSLVDCMVSNHHLSPDTATYTSLLNGYCNDFDNRMDDPDIYSNDNNCMDRGMMLIYHQMIEKGFKPDCVTYNRMIQRCFYSGLFEDGHKLLHDLLSQAQTLDSCTYCDILYELLRKEHVAEALSLFDLLDDDEQEEDSSKLNSDTSVLHVLLDGLISCGELDFARELYQGLSARGIKPTPEIYDVMMFGFFEEGLINEAKLFLQMEENHCWPTTNTYNCLLFDYLNKKWYDDVKVLLYKMKRQQHYLYDFTLSMLRDSVAAGSLDATLSNLINNLAR